VLTVGTLDRAGYLKVSWPAVCGWLLEKGVNQSGKSCRLRCASFPLHPPPLPLGEVERVCYTFYQTPLNLGCNCHRSTFLHVYILESDWRWNAAEGGGCCRYQNQLAPDLSRSSMTPCEDEAIMFVGPPTPLKPKGVLRCCDTTLLLLRE